MHELINKYLWAESDDIMGWTVAVIVGPPDQDVVRAYGGNPDQPVRRMMFDEAWRADGDQLRLWRQGDWVVAIEPNGVRGKNRDLARRLSAKGGRFFSASWNANGRWFIVEATDGALTAAFDVVRRGAEDLIPDWATSVTTDYVGALCLALMELRTGCVAEPSWITYPTLTYSLVQK